MVQAVIFDMDGVLAQYDFDQRMALMSEALGKSPEEIVAAGYDSGLDEEDEQGRLTPDLYLGRFSQLLGCAVPRAVWVAARRGSMTLDTQVLDLARALDRRGVTIATLTNNGPLLKAAMPEIAPEIPQIFGRRMHFSCDFRSRKPLPQVYLGLTQALTVRPQEALFIDDTDWCVEGAARVGLKTHHFQSAPKLAACLRDLGLLPA